MRTAGIIAVASTLALLILGLAIPAQAIETSNAEFVVIPTDDVLEDDLYAGSIKVNVQGEIDGDLIALAAEEVVIDGSVTGSVLAVAPAVTVNGVVGETLRMVGTSLTVGGRVGGDVVASAADVSLSASSTVEGDVLIWGWDVGSMGAIEGDLEGTQRSLELAGSVNGDIDVSVSQLRVVDLLDVRGDLGYRSNSDGQGLDMARVGGVIVDKDPLPPNIRLRALMLFGRILAVLFLTIAALGAAWGWPGRTQVAVGDVRARPWRSWVYGALVVFSPLMVIGLTALLLVLAPPAASLPLVAVILPIVTALVGLVGALSLVAGAPVVGWLGNRLFGNLDLYGAIVVGSAAVGILWFIPLVGWLVPLVVLPLGLGAWMLGFTGGGRDPEPAATPDGS